MATQFSRMRYCGLALSLLVGSLATAGETKTPTHLNFADSNCSRCRVNGCRNLWAEYLDVPADVVVPTWKTDHTKSNSISMQFRMIPPGEFKMGSADPMKQAPQHRVRISKPFYMSTFEVTREQFERVMGRAAAAPAAATASTCPSDDKNGASYPAENVSWYEATEFCRRLGGIEGRCGGKVFRLPTEAEWEYACRAATTSESYTGDGEAAIIRAGWIENSSAQRRVAPGKSHPIGGKEANMFGLFDMHGNVPEWCSDWFDASYYQHSAAVDPAGPRSGWKRVVRGGSYNQPASQCESSSRGNSEPNVARPGFRVVMEIPLPGQEDE